jgi:hypothetical protein
VRVTYTEEDRRGEVSTIEEVPAYWLDDGERVTEYLRY